MSWVGFVKWHQQLAIAWALLVLLSFFNHQYVFWAPAVRHAGGAAQQQQHCQAGRQHACQEAQQTAGNMIGCRSPCFSGVRCSDVGINDPIDCLVLLCRATFQLVNVSVSAGQV
jgi:hypothetical protein